MSFITANAGGIWKRFRKQVPSTSSLTVDSIPLPKFSSVKYIISFSNIIEDKRKTVELSAVRLTGDNINDSVNNVLGDTLDTQTNVTISGTDVILSIVNNESYPLDIKVSKLITT